MKFINNLKIVHEILNDKLPKYKFSALDILVFSTDTKVFFIGNKGNDRTLFKHSSDDKCYYDILDKNIMYYENSNKNRCSDLESIDNLVKIYERKEVI